MSPRFVRLVAQLEDKLSAWRELSERLEEAMDSSVPELFRTIRPPADRRGTPPHNTLEVPEVRPPVIPSELEEELLPYLRFRHLFNGRLDWGRMEGLVLRMPDVMGRPFFLMRDLAEA